MNTPINVTSDLVQQIVLLCTTLENIKQYATCLQNQQYGDATKDIIIMRMTRQWILFMELTGAASTEWDNFEGLMSLGRYDALVNFPSSIIGTIAAKLPVDCQEALRAYARGT